MVKLKLEIEYDYDFILIGISCHEKPYRLAWAVNNELGITLERSELLSISLKKNEAPSGFVNFNFEHPDHEVSYTLVQNRSETGMLIPELSQADYFLIARGPFGTSEQDEILRRMKAVSFVLTAFAVDPEQLKSKQNLLF
ncbi:MAG: hypothetical protein Fur0041_04660 [Bacteroidia bacterium]